MTGSAPVVGVVLVAQILGAQTNKPWNVDRVCGRAQYLKRIPEKKHPNIYSDERKDLKGIRLELYESNGVTPCCDGLRNIGTTVSGKRGQFDFKLDHAGHYWLVAVWNEKSYKVPAIYKPAERSSMVCSEQGIQIEDDGDSSWWATVRVD